LDLGARPLAEQHAVASLDVERLNLAVFSPGPGADRDHLALHRLFLRRIGDDDAARGLLFRFDAPHYDTVMQWTESHFEPPRTSDLKFAWHPLPESAGRKSLHVCSVKQVAGILIG